MSVFGPSLFSSLSKRTVQSLKPLADRYAHLCGYRQVGLKAEDLLLEENAVVQKALGRLSERESYDRAFRLRTASMASIAHQDLPKEQWVKPEDDKRYLKPFILEVEAENADRVKYDTAVRA
ncbi:hypothetical protein JCM10207_005763 [Rhodosporidiobolus poonsookiae]